VVPALVGTLALAGCTGAPIGGDDVAAELADIDVAATVDGIEITGAEVAELLAAREAMLSDEPDTALNVERANLSREILGQLIQLRAVEAAVAERFDVVVTEILSADDIAAAVEADIELAGGQEAYELAATEQGIDLATARTFSEEAAYIRLLITFVQEQISVESGVTEDSLRAVYDADSSAYQQSDTSHILLATEEDALAAQLRLEAGEDFAELAIELSTGPSGPTGGVLGLAPRGSYVPAFSEAVYADTTVIGEVVGPVETEFGFHLILVNDIVTAPFEDVLETLRQAAIGDEYGAFIDGIFDGMDVTVDEAIGSWNAEILTVEPPIGDAPTDAPTDAPIDAPTEAPSDQPSEVLSEG
jgi:parvulin-like peptidyl-prolyl isomerase